MADNKKKLTNKLAVLQVLACLMKNPLLCNRAEFTLTMDDFTEQFHRILFGAISNLATSGLKTITHIDVDQYLAQYPIQYKVFTDNRGVEYVIKALEIAEERNFPYYYNTLKKMSLLNKLVEQGFDISDFYDDNVVDPIKTAEMQERLDSYSIEQILALYETKLIQVKDDFSKNRGIVQTKSGDGLRETKERFKETPEVGLPLTMSKLTTLYRGQRLKKLYLESSAQGVGKSRRMAAESAHLAVPKIFDVERNAWKTTNLCESVLYISTELELEEVQTMWLAYVSGVPEHKILNGNYGPGEEQRVDIAVELLEQANLYFVQISNYDMDDIEQLIRKYYQIEHVNYVYYDYLSTTIKIMSEGASKSKISNLREDQILLMFTTRLKDLCNELDIYIWTATQLSGDWKNAKEADQQLLRGAKSISDKIDIGSIMLPVRESDRQVIDSYVAKGFQVEPTHVIHVYKVRRGQYNNIKVYINFDRSTCRATECFVTDNNGNLLTIEDTSVEVVLDKTFEEKYGFTF